MGEFRLVGYWRGRRFSKRFGLLQVDGRFGNMPVHRRGGSPSVFSTDREIDRVLLLRVRVPTLILKIPSLTRLLLISLFEFGEGRVLDSIRTGYLNFRVSDVAQFPMFFPSLRVVLDVLVFFHHSVRSAQLLYNLIRR